MKRLKIYMQSWLDAHDRVKVADTDKWYLDLANDLLPLVAESPMYMCDPAEDIQQIALMLALYMEDCVADGGNWREFIHWHKESYGRYLPFYTLTEEYVPDEINREDIAFILWGINDPGGETYDGVWNPMDEDILGLAGKIYNLLDAAFESAPISEHLAVDWLMETELMERQREPLPAVVPGEKLPTNVERFFEASGGESLMFFDSYAMLKLFFVQSLKWEDTEDSLLPELEECENFVLYANPKGLLIGPDIAAYFADKRNPIYNAGEAETDAYELFCMEGLCPFDLLKYGMEHNLLLEAQFPFENGKALLMENWDFVARWFLGDYYEGK